MAVLVGNARSVSLSLCLSVSLSLSLSPSLVCQDRRDSEEQNKNLKLQRYQQTRLRKHRFSRPASHYLHPENPQPSPHTLLPPHTPLSYTPTPSPSHTPILHCYTLTHPYTHTLHTFRPPPLNLHPPNLFCPRLNPSSLNESPDRQIWTLELGSEVKIAALLKP